MSNLEVSKFRRLLEAKHSELMSATSNRDEIAVETAADEIDRLQQHLGREVAVRNLNQQSELLKSVIAALDRIDGEIYGECLRCEGPIPENRLRAVPWASHCVRCQELIDVEDRRFQGDSMRIGFGS